MIRFTKFTLLLMIMVFLLPSAVALAFSPSSIDINGDGVHIDEVVKYITSDMRQDLTGDGAFNRQDIEKLLSMVAPQQISVNPVPSTAAIAGVVIAMNQPLPNATVSIYSGEFSENMGSPLATVLTDTYGNYNFSQLTSGIYTLGFNKAGYIPKYVTRSLVGENLLNETLHSTGVTGFVYGLGGTPLSGVTVTDSAYSSVPSSTYMTYTDIDGRYALYDFPPNQTVTMTFAKEGYQNYTTGEFSVPAGILRGQENVGLTPTVAPPGYGHATVTVTTPAFGQTLNTPATLTISGTAADPEGQTIQSVKVALKDSYGLYLNDYGFFSSTPIYFTATGTSNWSIAFDGTSWTDGLYFIEAKASDGFDSPAVTSYFIVDTIPPGFSAESERVFSGPVLGSVQIEAAMREPGTVYYVVVPAGDSAPSQAQVLAGQDATGSLAAGHGSISVAKAYETFTQVVAGLTPGSAYTTYYVLKDAVNTSGVIASYFLSVPASDKALLLQNINYAAGSTYDWSNVTPSTFADLNITGVSDANFRGVQSVLESVYYTGFADYLEIQGYIDGLSFSLNQINLAALDNSWNPREIFELTFMDAGVLYVYFDNLTAVKDAVYGARQSKGADLTLSEVQASVSLTVINDSAQQNGWWLYDPYLFASAGVAGVNEGNLYAVQNVVAAAYTAKGSGLTLAEIQSAVNTLPAALNKINAALAGNGPLLPDWNAITVNDFSAAGIEYVSEINFSAVKNALYSYYLQAGLRPLTLYEIQEVVYGTVLS